MLAEMKFEGLPRTAEGVPLRIALERPPALRDVNLQEYYALVDHWMSLNDEQLCAIDPNDEVAEEIIEFSNACHFIAEWHRDVAKTYDSLFARLMIRAARRELAGQGE